MLLTEAAKSLRIELEKDPLPYKDFLENKKPILLWKNNGPIKLEAIAAKVLEPLEIDANQTEVKQYTDKGKPTKQFLAAINSDG